MRDVKEQVMVLALGGGGARNRASVAVNLSTIATGPAHCGSSSVVATGCDSAVAASCAKHNGSNLARAPVSQEREVPDAHEAPEGHASNRSHVDRAVII